MSARLWRRSSQSGDRNGFVGFLDDELLKKIADAINDQLATNLNVRGRTNIASGNPASIGKIGPGGIPQYDGVDNVVPHMDLYSQELQVRLG